VRRFLPAMANSSSLGLLAMQCHADADVYTAAEVSREYENPKLLPAVLAVACRGS
jgi:hypothetical protein